MGNMVTLELNIVQDNSSHMYPIRKYEVRLKGYGSLRDQNKTRRAIKLH